MAITPVCDGAAGIDLGGGVWSLHRREAGDHESTTSRRGDFVSITVPRLPFDPELEAALAAVSEELPLMTLETIR